MPSSPPEDEKDLVLIVTGKAPGFLDCVLENRGDFNWHVKGYTDTPIKTVQYWDGSDWKTPSRFRCGTGVMPQVIKPGRKWHFRAYAEFSQPRVVISAWDYFSMGNDRVEVIGQPPVQPTNSHPYDSQKDLGDGMLEWATQIRKEQQSEAEQDVGAVDK